MHLEMLTHIHLLQLFNWIDKIQSTIFRASGELNHSMRTTESLLHPASTTRRISISLEHVLGKVQ